MNAEYLFNWIKKVIIGLEEIGFKVICVSTDNNAINKKALSYFSSPAKLSIVYQHPVDMTRPLFFMFDAVHLLKCIRNNWLRQTDPDQSMKFPHFSFEGTIEIGPEIRTAPFATVKKLHNLEAHSLLKHAYKLTFKSLFPSNIEKQNVNLALKIFSDYVVQALLTIGKKNSLPFCEDVAEYIKVIRTWWTIMNVKTPLKGNHLRDKYSFPLTNDENDELYFS